ncbi:MAG: DUF4254 domain-containing protein [Planctomycetota bacterium]|nr:DUF4254 domain-containing protein [Planctomycetota bacterium]MDA1165458.1 DUF4254 domain-containing protein [Planctomycetota bacterium]
MKTAEITRLQRARTIEWHKCLPDGHPDGLAGLVERNHLQNFLLWHEEDIARCDDLGAERIMQAKRVIDRCNQTRNDLVEQMDRFLVSELNPAESGCPFNSETPGMMVDRLSILALKQYHMNEEVERADASEAHRTKCSDKLTVISRQIEDLSEALSTLQEQVRAQTRSFRVYFQFKMYNDSELNPELRRAS